MKMYLGSCSIEFESTVEIEDMSLMSRELSDFLNFSIQKFLKSKEIKSPTLETFFIDSFQKISDTDEILEKD